MREGADVTNRLELLQECRLVDCRPGRESGLTELSAQLVPPEYYDYLSIFSEEEAKALPPRRYVDHAIPLIEGGKPPFG